MLTGTVEADQLRLFIERIERLEEEKKGIADDVKDVYAEAKANGYDVKTMRKIVALRKIDPRARQEADALLDTYKAALGMDTFDTTPLSQAAENLHSLADEHGASIEVRTGDGETIAQFGKKKSKATRKVRDPSDGGLVTVAANG